jgi:hypothetical protein
MSEPVLMKRQSLTLILAALLMQSAPAMAKGPQIMPGAEATQHVNLLTSQINWYHSLSQAEQAARQQNKMIFWIQMLGDISGAT